MKSTQPRRIPGTLNSGLFHPHRHWLRVRTATRSDGYAHGGSIPADVVVYFPDVEVKTYQLSQWLPVLERLNEHLRVLLVFRKAGALRAIRAKTALPSVLVRRFSDLRRLYDENNYPVCLYVNNGVRNFQSLSERRMIHIHVSHGESDKLSMVCNQVQAYDKVMIAGPAALERHRVVLGSFDESKLLAIGRPQLDIEFPHELSPYSGKTVMYAPTWQGQSEANNYTSVDVYGVQIVETILDRTDYRLVYKPHPRIIDSRDSRVLSAHSEIISAIKTANYDGGNHVIAENGNVLAMFSHVDALITDVSSVGPDFLYLHPDRPMILADRRDDAGRLVEEVPISRACPVIHSGSVGDLTSLISQLFEGGDLQRTRREMRRFYFGDMTKGESTRTFIRTLQGLVDSQSRLFGRHGEPAANAAGE